MTLRKDNAMLVCQAVGAGRNPTKVYISIDLSWGTTEYVPDRYTGVFFSLRLQICLGNNGAAFGRQDPAGYMVTGFECVSPRHSADGCGEIHQSSTGKKQVKKVQER